MEKKEKKRKGSSRRGRRGKGGKVKKGGKKKIVNRKHVRKASVQNWNMHGERAQAGKGHANPV